MRATATMRAVRGWVLAAGVTGALGFGGVQAVAAPAPGGEGEAACNARLCNRVCQSIGSIGGFCTSEGSCVCYIGG